MGKITQFDQSRRTHFPKSGIKREAKHAAARAGAPQNYQRRPARRGRDISGSAICILALLTFFAIWLVPDYLMPRSMPMNLSSSTSTDTQSAVFGYCHNGGGFNCVVDGDTIWLSGQKIRIADIDTPETHPARCVEEQRLGDAATRRLQELMNAGPFSLESIDRDTDRYGRSLRIVTREGESVGGVLVNEGLARWYDGGRRSWC